MLKPGGVALVTVAPPLQANLYPLVNRLTSSMRVSDLTRLKQFFQSERQLRTAFDAAGFKATAVHGVYGGPMVWIERIAPALMPPLLKAWEVIDSATADAPLLKHLSNMFLVRASK